MDIYWKRFESMFEAHAKRKACAQLLEVRNAMIAGAWSNSNYDPQEEGKEGPRPKMLEEIDEGFKRAILEVRTGKKAQEDEIDWTDPFFAAIKSPRIGTEDSVMAGMMEEAAAREGGAEATRKMLAEAGKGIDQG